MNTHVVVNDKGSITSLYRKLHLFDVEVPNGPVAQESRYTQGGVHTVVTHSPLGTLGLTTCYDVRFPELYTHLAAKGAEVRHGVAAFRELSRSFAKHFTFYPSLFLHTLNFSFRTLGRSCSCQAPSRFPRGKRAIGKCCSGRAPSRRKAT